VIKSFADADSERVFKGQRTRRLPSSIRKRAVRKLLILNAAETAQELRVPPGNRLERLKGDRAEQYSMRINDQWRICFFWRSGDAYEVEITENHG